MLRIVDRIRDHGQPGGSSEAVRFRIGPHAVIMPCAPPIGGSGCRAQFRAIRHDGTVSIERRGGRIAYESPWLRLRVDDIVYPDGTLGQYSVVEKRDFVVILPWQDDGFWLVEQYRYPIGQRAWEFPQGGWRDGQSGTQPELAVTELKEETGLTAGTWRHLGRLFAAYGYSNQAFDIYLATDLRAGEPDREPTEQDMVHRWVPLAQLRAMIQDGRLADAHSVAAITLFDADRQRRS
jgi:8-oxo-dGTP pyrophosphatase MutT (NUDIX family)